jgi:alanyl-tRNA synthetase
MASSRLSGRGLSEAQDKTRTPLAGLDAQSQKFKALEKDLFAAAGKDPGVDVEEMVKRGRRVKDIVVIEHQFKNADIGFLRRCVDLLKGKVASAGIFFLSGQKDEDAYFVCGVTQDAAQKGLAADALLKKTLNAFGGSGGGRRDFAQGGLKDISKTEAVFKEFGRLIQEVL